MLKAECHCGNLSLVAQELPKSITRCNCSICDRLGARWAYYDAAQVDIRTGDHPLETYAFAEQSIIYHRCGHCGCTTHYSSTEADGGETIAINCRMALANQLDGIAERQFDGRDSWQYLED